MEETSKKTYVLKLMKIDKYFSIWKHLFLITFPVLETVITTESK